MNSGNMFVVLMLAFTLAVASTVQSQETHRWDSISYPELPTQFGDGTARPVIRNTEDGLQLSLSFGWTDEQAAADGFSLPDGTQIKLALHHPDGNATLPLDSSFNRGLITTGGRGYSSGAFQCRFPWQSNRMTEAWLEINMPQHSFWLELPYGFTRNPHSKKLPTARTGRPQALAKDATSDNVSMIQWQHVVYDVGEIQDDWRLTLKQANPFDASSELVLHRNDTEVGKSMFLWDLHSPRTKVTIIHADGSQLDSRAMSLRLHDDGMRRSDGFQFNRNPGNGESRDWGQMMIEIDDRTWQITMPSSLFRYVHGHADAGS